ncbi:MAG TPA: hypothetical protein VN281_09550 [Verrucomicrobiae bacterium]|nr:hypothetical protein [Verrucomicrobiae bacterium]
MRYLQVINIRDTGIDFAVKPVRIAEGSHNDPDRSRVGAEDILFTNNALRLSFAALPSSLCYDATSPIYQTARRAKAALRNDQLR